MVLRCAGGWVRDKMLGLQSTDIDIALDTMLGEQFGQALLPFLEKVRSPVPLPPHTHAHDARTPTPGPRPAAVCALALTAYFMPWVLRVWDITSASAGAQTLP